MMFNLGAHLLKIIIMLYIFTKRVYKNTLFIHSYLLVIPLIICIRITSWSFVTCINNMCAPLEIKLLLEYQYIDIPPQRVNK